MPQTTFYNEKVLTFLGNTKVEVQSLISRLKLLKVQY